MGFQDSFTGRQSSFRRMRPVAEINVTPFVDVMLVLLIIFMVTAPLLVSGVSVDLPGSSAGPLADAGEPVTVTVSADGTIYVQDMPAGYDELVSRLEAVATGGYEQRIFIRADRTRAYGDVVKVMGLIDSAGFRQIALVTTPLQE